MKNAILKVDLDALLYNYRHLKCYYKKNIIAVIKDDAYGLGLIEVANTLKDDETIIFAVSSLDDAKKLRNNNVYNSILYLNVFDETDLMEIEKYNITAIVQSYNQLVQLKNKRIPFHLKFNTGMNRLGIYQYEENEVINEVNKNKDKYLLKGIMTHIADDDKYHECYYRFKQIVERVKYDNLIIHCFASGSLNLYFENICNYVRVGIKLYGIGDRHMFLHNVVSLFSPILQIKKIKEKEKVGYDYAYETKQNGYLYILPIGYGQGWGTFASSIGYSNNNYLRQAGKISMDYSTYFSNKLLDSNQEIELLGKHINIEQLCSINNLKPHELLVKLKINIIYEKKGI